MQKQMSATAVSGAATHLVSATRMHGGESMTQFSANNWVHEAINQSSRLLRTMVRDAGSSGKDGNSDDDHLLVFACSQ